MKKSLSLLCVLGCFAQPALAANINLGTAGFNQADFRAFSEDLGSALSYKAVTPAAPLGFPGVDIGMEVTGTKLQNVQVLNKATGSTSSSATLPLPKLHAFVGLPFGIDVGASYASVPGTNIKVMGGELRYAIIGGGMALPAVAVRGSFSKLSGVDSMALGTKALDVSVSKGFLMLTPYVGVGTVWVNSEANYAGTTLAKETFRQNKVFAGANLNLGLTNFALEYDKTGKASSYTVKMGFRF